MTIEHITDNDFEEKVVKSTTPVLIDFWTEWCGPGKAIAPTLEELASEFDGKIKVVKINIDDNPNTPVKFGIQGIPTLLMIKEGMEHSRQVGVQPKAQLTDWINGVI